MSADYPEAWALLNKDARGTLVRRFPYGVLYSIEENEEKEIYILAVMNLHRDPDYWKDRTLQPLMTV
jgi:hypothetical protein